MPVHAISKRSIIKQYEYSEGVIETVQSVCGVLWLPLDEVIETTEEVTCKTCLRVIETRRIKEEK